MLSRSLMHILLEKNLLNLPSNFSMKVLCNFVWKSAYSGFFLVCSYLLFLIVFIVSIYEMTKYSRKNFIIDGSLDLFIKLNYQQTQLLFAM